MAFGKFNNPIVGAANTLIRAAIRSLNYVPGLSGWTINFDGTAEFTGVTISGDITSGPLAGGHVVIHNGEMRFYNALGLLWLFIDPVGSGGGNEGQVHFYDTAGTETITLDGGIGGSGILNVGNISYTLGGSNSIFFQTQSPLAAGSCVKLINGAVNAPFGIPAGLIAYSSSTSVLAGTGATEVQDTGVGNLQFTLDINRTYRVFYRARAQTTTTGTSIQWRIRDGAGSAPTSASTLVGASQCTPAGTGGAGDEMLVNQLLNAAGGMAAGTHILGAFYVRTSGGGTVNPSQSFTREFYLWDEG